MPDTHPVLRWFRPLLLVLVLLAVQQGGVLHGYEHASHDVAHALGAGALLHDDPADEPDESALCLDCLAFSAVASVLTGSSGSSPPVLARVVTSASAVPPEPTFSPCVAFQSRAPPVFQS